MVVNLTFLETLSSCRRQTQHKISSVHGWQRTCIEMRRSRTRAHCGTGFEDRHLQMAEFNEEEHKVHFVTAICGTFDITSGLQLKYHFICETGSSCMVSRTVLLHSMSLDGTCQPKAAHCCCWYFCICCIPLHMAISQYSGVLRIEERQWLIVDRFFRGQAVSTKFGSIVLIQTLCQPYSIRRSS